ncbi:MAG TPA: chemotaxis protein CheW [Tepidisphaeraceae bacterium]|nr:chemotaxis protein CheW [Tepidisphaeraceae bacterium]
MEAIDGLTEQLASAATLIEADDLSALAELHGFFQQLDRWFEAHPQGHPRHQQIRQASTQAQGVLEKLVLHEADDVDAAVNQVLALVSEIQRSASLAAESEQPATQAPNPVVTAAPIMPTPAPAAEALQAEKPVAVDDLPLVRDFIAESMSHMESAEAALLKIEEAPDDIEAINSVFRSFHTIKGSAGFLNLKQIGALAHATENLLDLARKGKLSLVGDVADVVLESLDAMKGLIMTLRDTAEAGQAAPSEPRVPELIQRLHAAARGEAVKTQPKAAAAPAPAPQTTGAAAPATQPVKPAPQPAASKDAGADATVKVSTERLDSLINQVGELVIAQSMVSQDMAATARANPKHARNLSHLGKITREMQDLAMSMRMVPIQGVFQKMARVVRDLTKKAGKEVDFVTVGGETELDRNLVDSISDPLIHMVRNSCDHGIEMPDARVQSGKPRAGRIELRAFHQGGSIAIQIIDDGKGLPKARILQKAIDAGIVKPGQELSEQEIFKLIFHAGLSTAEKVTDVSGRGVGMDVVKRNVEALRGRIDITSTEGQGSTFTIRLPLTLAVIEGLVVKVGSQRYIIPITSVEQTIQPKRDQLSTVQGRGEICLVRGAPLPLYRLHKIFNIEPRTRDVTEALVLILHDNDRRCCLLVDELLGQQQVVIKSMGESLGTVRGISGAAILGDGSASLILDVAGIMDIAVA